MNRTGHNMDIDRTTWTGQDVMDRTGLHEQDKSQHGHEQDDMNRTGHNVGMNRTIWTGEGDMDRTGHNKDIDRMT